MNLRAWTLAIATCVAEGQFWREALKESFYLVTHSSNGLGVAVTSAILAIGHRIVRKARSTICLQARATLRARINRRRQHPLGNANA
jgi:hypothetical protein